MYVKFSFYGYSVELAENESLRQHTEWFLHHTNFKRDIQKITFAIYVLFFDNCVSHILFPKRIDQYIMKGSVVNAINTKKKLYN